MLPLINFTSLVILITLPFYVNCNLWCYSCVSNQPGCSEFHVNWLIQSAITCPKANDKCVKIIETIGSETLVTRDCLSNLEGLRFDIPGDKYEGCRPASHNPKSAVYVENNVDQLQLHGKEKSNVTWCFCEFDEWCNKGINVKYSLLTSIVTICISLFISFILFK